MEIKKKITIDNLNVGIQEVITIDKRKIALSP